MGLGQTTSMSCFDWLARAAAQSNGYLKGSKIAYIGLRDVELAEKKTLQYHNIKAYSMIDVVQKGISTTMDEILDYFGNVPLHVSFDIDSVDPFFAPSTGTPVNAGLLERDVRLLAAILCRSSNLVSLDVVEVNPSLGSSEDSKNTVQIARRLTSSFLQDFYD
jgi:arginase